MKAIDEVVSKVLENQKYIKVMTDNFSFIDRLADTQTNKEDK